jgi:hypothetical protein
VAVSRVRSRRRQSPGLLRLYQPVLCPSCLFCRASPSLFLLFSCFPSFQTSYHTPYFVCSPCVLCSLVFRDLFCSSRLLISVHYHDAGQSCSQPRLPSTFREDRFESVSFCVACINRPCSPIANPPTSFSFPSHKTFLHLQRPRLTTNLSQPGLSAVSFRRLSYYTNTFAKTKHTYTHMVMTRLPSKLNLLVLLSLLSTASAAPSSLLFARQNTCKAEGFEVCGNGFPSNFCCPSGTSCLSLAGDTTVLCCPEGSTCNKIESITCNLDALDPEDNPRAPVKTTVLDVALEKCKDGTCCPFGYSCAGDGRCQKNEDQSEAPKADEPSTTTTRPPAEPTAEPTADPTETDSDSPTETDQPAASATNGDGESDNANEDSGPDTASIVGGVVGGCAILLIVAVALLIVVRRRAKKAPMTEKSQQKHGRTKSNGFSNIISDPILQPDQYRADLILRPPPTTSTTQEPRWPDRQASTRRQHPRVSIPNPFNSPNPSVAGSASRASTMTDDSDDNMRTGQVTSGARLPPIRSMKASSRHLRPSDAMHRQPSAESINVFADPITVDRSQQRQTTFTDLMDEADLRGVGKDRPFVQVPGTTPRI